MVSGGRLATTGNLRNWEATEGGEGYLFVIITFKCHDGDHVITAG